MQLIHKCDVALCCSQVLLTTVNRPVVDVCVHAVRTVMTVLTSLFHLRDTGVQHTAMTHCIATEVMEKPQKAQYCV